MNVYEADEYNATIIILRLIASNTGRASRKAPEVN